MTLPDSQRDLHIRRIREALTQIPEWRKTPGAPQTRGFQSWKDRIESSLREAFGIKHEYSRRFGNLHFCLPRIAMGPRPAWSDQDEHAYQDDLFKAESLLQDALEEAQLLPDIPSSNAAQVASPLSPISVQILNVLSQVTSVDVKQIVASIDTLPLDADAKQAAKEQVRLLEEEARGEHRWTVIGKSLDYLKGLGKDVYEKVALPLLLEIIKKHAGLS